jgi:hypothetical protein
MKTDQPTNGPTNQPTNQPINQPTDQPTNQQIDQPTNQPTNRPMDQPTNQQTNERTNSFLEALCSRLKKTVKSCGGGAMMEHEGPLGLYKPKTDKCLKLLRLRKFQYHESQSQFYLISFSQKNTFFRN